MHQLGWDISWTLGHSSAVPGFREYTLARWTAGGVKMNPRNGVRMVGLVVGLYVCVSCVLVGVVSLCIGLCVW